MDWIGRFKQCTIGTSSQDLTIKNPEDPGNDSAKTFPHALRRKRIIQSPGFRDGNHRSNNAKIWVEFFLLPDPDPVSDFCEEYADSGSDSWTE